MTLGRNVNDFSSGSTKVTEKISSSDQVLCYIGNTNEPVYLPISVLKQQTEQQVISEDITANGVDGNTTAKLIYGVNVVTTASGTDYAIRLPYPPIKGRTVTIINTSGVPIVIYPSIVGGSINGVVNGTATVPPDSNAYTFTCWENPLPGAWSWTPPATRQYDSGEISVASPLGNGVITASNPFNVSVSPTLSGTLDGFDGINKSLFLNYNDNFGGQVSIFKPSTVWNQITKIKVYTNKIVVGSGITVRIVGSSYFNYYNKLTGAFYDGALYQTSQFGTDLSVTTAVAGTPVPSPPDSVVSLNIGDAGTLYGENAIASLVPVPTNITYNVAYPQVTYPTVFGDVYVKDVVIDNVTYEQWYTQYLSVNIVPRCGTPSVPFKYRFFIEYN